MMFKRIDHVEIVTDQLERTAQFFEKIGRFRDWLLGEAADDARRLKNLSR